MPDQPERTLTMIAKALPQNRLLGLRQEWISGDDGHGVKFDLDCGAGLGNPQLSVLVRFPDGPSVREVVDIRDVAQQWVGAIIDEHESESTDG